MLRLGDEDRAALADDPVALMKNQLDEARVLLRLYREPLRLCRWGDAIKQHDPAFRLRDNLLRDDHDVAGLDAGLLAGSLDDQSGKGVTLADFGQSGNRDDVDFGHVVSV